MLQAMNFDWSGTQKELKKMTDGFKKGCKDCEGIEFKGLYSPHTAKWHYTMFWETDNFHRWEEAMQIAQEKYGSEPRDYKKLTHASFEVWADYNIPT